MEHTFWTALGASLLAALVTAIGIYTIRYFEAWGRKYSIHFICFAAGVLISVSFLHIIPKAFEMSANAPVYLLCGFFCYICSNRFITAFVCERGLNPNYGIGLVPMIGIGLHSFIDSFVYSITSGLITMRISCHATRQQRLSTPMDSAPMNSVLIQ